MDYQQIFGYMATCFSCCFYFFLVVPFLNVLRCKLNYEFTPIILIDTVYVDAVAWYNYSLKIFNPQLKLCNTIGCCATLILIVIYLAFEVKHYLIDSVLNVLILILGTLVLNKGLSMVIEDATSVGRICMCTKIITFLVPLYLMFKVYQDKNYKLISANITLSYLASCVGWTLFGKSINDYNIMIANGIGILICLVQFGIYLSSKKKYRFQDSSSTISTSTIGIEKASDDTRKDDSFSMSMDNLEEKAARAKEKPVRIVTRIEN